MRERLEAGDAPEACLAQRLRHTPFHKCVFMLMSPKGRKWSTDPSPATSLQVTREVNCGGYRYDIALKIHHERAQYEDFKALDTFYK